MTDAPRSTRIRWRRTLWIIGIVFVWLAAIVDITIRDAFPVFLTIFYATPPIILALLSFAVVCIERKRFDLRSRWINRATLFLGVISLIQWGYVNFRIRPRAEPSPHAITLAFWNTGRGHFADWDRIAKQVSQFDADVIALAEATSDDVQTRDFWAQYLPDHQAVPLHRGMLLLVKGKAKFASAGSLENRGDFRHFSLVVNESHFDVILADLASSPHRSRQAPLSKLSHIMEPLTATPTLVVGDFNTPPNSVWFDNWRPEWQRAWDVAGHGYQPTWPQPLPVLTLDHVWGNHHIAFEACVPGWSSASDHRPLIVKFSIRN